MLWSVFSNYDAANVFVQVVRPGLFQSLYASLAASHDVEPAYSLIFPGTRYILRISASLRQACNSELRSSDFQYFVFQIYPLFTFHLWCRQSSRSWSEWDAHVTGSHALLLKCIISVADLLPVPQSISIRLSRTMNQRLYNLVNHLHAIFLQHEMQPKCDYTFRDDICDRSNGQTRSLILPLTL
jgi:hypothetical protein